MLNTSLHFLALFGCGAFTGMLLTIGMSFGSFWRSLTPEELLDWFAAHPRGAARPLSVILIPTLIGLGGALWLEWSDATVRPFWIGAMASMVLLLVFTVVYFFPVNGKLEHRAILPNLVPATLNRWLAFHWIRVILSLLAGILAFLAMTASP
jgi:hypothetical protein